MKIDTVCIIDDDPICVYGTKILLNHNNFVSADILVYEDGDEALTNLTNQLDKGQPMPDIILLDLNMPVMNGFEFLEAYREKFGDNVPIVVVTGADLTEKDKEFLSGEVTRILEKAPDTEGTIASDVAKVLRNVKMG